MAITIEGITPLHIVSLFICLLAYWVFRRAGWRKLWAFVTEEFFWAYAENKWGVKRNTKEQKDLKEKRQDMEKGALPVQSR